MKKLLIWLLLSSGAAVAAPFLGTTNSFFSSSFCAVYRCSFLSKESLTANIVEFRYRLIAGGLALGDEFQQPVVSVIRVNNIVTSIGFVIGVSDTALPSGDPLTRMWSRATSLAVGTPVSETTVTRLDYACEKAKGAAAVLRLGRFTASCINTGAEFEGGRRVAFRVYR